MRQVGDRLIPIGITSGRIVALPPGTEGDSGEEPPSASSLGGRRSRRRDRNGGDGNNGDMQQYLGPLIAGPDLEEVTLMA